MHPRSPNYRDGIHSVSYFAHILVLQQRLADGNRAIERIGQNQAIGRLAITNHVKNAFLPVKDVTIGYASLHSGYAHFFYAHIALHESARIMSDMEEGKAFFLFPFIFINKR